MRQAPGRGVQDHRPAVVLGSVRDGEARGPARERDAPGAGGGRPCGGVARLPACSLAAATGPLSRSVLSRGPRERAGGSRRLGPHGLPTLTLCTVGAVTPSLHPKSQSP